MKPSFCIKCLMFIFASLCGMHGYCQTFTKYFDSNWISVPKEKAFYQTDFTKDGEVYHCTSYWVSSGKLYGTSMYADTIFTKGIGVRKVYYEKGSLKDSMLYDNAGKVETIDEFSENGMQTMHAFYDAKENDMKAELFDEKGNKKQGFITYQKPAKFPGGSDGWISYLQTHLKADIPTRKKAPAGIYTVVVSFLVNKDGKISEVKAESDPGYGTAEEAVRVIQKGPDWIPAVQNNKTVIYRQLQPISFQVMEAKR